VAVHSAVDLGDGVLASKVEFHEWVSPWFVLESAWRSVGRLSELDKTAYDVRVELGADDERRESEELAWEAR
jgi:hypothetical protein